METGKTTQQNTNSYNQPDKLSNNLRIQKHKPDDLSSTAITSFAEAEVVVLEVTVFSASVSKSYTALLSKKKKGLFVVTRSPVKEAKQKNKGENSKKHAKK